MPWTKNYLLRTFKDRKSPTNNAISLKISWEKAIVLSKEPRKRIEHLQPVKSQKVGKGRGRWSRSQSRLDWEWTIGKKEVQRLIKRHSFSKRNCLIKVREPAWNSTSFSRDFLPESRRNKRYCTETQKCFPILALNDFMLFISICLFFRW